MTCSIETACRSCAATGLHEVFSPGETPLANALCQADQVGKPQPHYPLTLVYCRHCHLLQIRETIDKRELFGDYAYFSSFSATGVAHGQQIAASLSQSRRLDSDSLVIEVGSNDGYLLANFVAQGIPVLGIEPATNIAAVSEARGVRTRNEFFSNALAEQLVADSEQADLLLGNNVLAHVSDLNDFVAGVRRVLKLEGVAVFEFPYAREMIDRVEFDTIYHEHLCYFSLTAVQALFARHELALVDVARLPIHGGSLRITVAKDPAEPVRNSVGEMLAEERRAGLLSADYYDTLGHRAERLRQQLLECLSQCRAAGKSVAAYGASAKGSTLMAYCGLGTADLGFVADRSSYKQGCFTPGNHIPIVAPEQILARRPAYLLLLTWNFAEEILAQQSRYRADGGKFIIPVPEVRIA